MQRIKQHKFIWLGIIVLGVTLLGMPAVYAQDEQPLLGPTADEVNYEEDDYDADSPEYVFGFWEDFVYTPVDPCRIVDTRNAGGKIGSNSYRSFNVWGSVSGQGGNPAGCTAPRGEPRAVHINIVAVGSTANGHLTVWPYNTTRPLASVLNYSPTDKTDPVSNAFTVKTEFGASYDISVYAYKETHVVADVMGYYYDAEVEKVVAAASSGTSSSTISVGTTYTTIASKSVTIPKYGRVLLMGEASWSNNGTGYLTCAFYEGSSQVDTWYWEAGDTNFYDQHQTRFFLKTGVTAGFKTYSLRCYRYGGTGATAYKSNLTIQFFSAGM